jgi:lipoic acid synthetase
MKVDRYVEPAEFDNWKEVAENLGFLYVASGPLVRSSYKVSRTFVYLYVLISPRLQAGEFYIENVLRGKNKAIRGLGISKLEDSEKGSLTGIDR